MKSTSGKKFKPNQVISGKEYDTMLKRLVKAAGESENAYKLGEGDFFGDEDISRQQAIHFLYLAYQATRDTDYLATIYMDDRAVNYTISPADNKKLCLDNWWSMDHGTAFKLLEKNGNTPNQIFCLRKTNGFLSIYNKCSSYTLTGTKEGGHISMIRDMKARR